MTKFIIDKTYFNKLTENAIINYNNSDDEHYRNELYDKYIKFSFEKLAENLIYDGKHNKFDESYNELKNDAICYLIEQLHLYKLEKGKAFSYFNMICRNYFIKRSKDKYQQLINEADIEQIDYNRNISNEINRMQLIDNINYFIDAFADHMRKNLTVYFKKKRDQDIALSVITLLCNRIRIENFNKKALYIMIREMTNAKTHIITKVINIMKVYYEIMFREYDKYDYITLLSPEEIKKLKKL
jgi:hypothetical protein